MADTFDPKSVTIKELFGSTESLYIIPDYQRPYSWVDDQVERIWEDLWDSYKIYKYNPNSDEEYFLGSIIVAESKTGYLQVIDGQQRLTTLTILIASIKSLFPDLNKDVNLSDNPKSVTVKTLENSLKYEGSEGRLIFKTHPHYNADFKEIIIDGDDNKIKLTNILKPTKAQLNDINPKYKFHNTAHIFVQKLSSSEVSEDIGSFVNYLFNKIKIIKIKCSNERFGIKLFQVLNDRGLDLTPTDLIKSYLLSEVPEDDRPEFMSSWKDIENQVERTDHKINDFFVFYQYFLLASNPKKSVNEELEIQFKGKNPLKIVKDIDNFISTYINEIYESKNKDIYALRYIPWEFYWKTIVTTAFHTKYEQTDELISLLKKFYYKYWIAGDTLTKIKQTSFNVLKAVKEGQNLSLIEKTLNEKIDDDNVNYRFKENLLLDVYNTSWIKPMLLNFEYMLSDSYDQEFIELKKNIHAEHIVPASHKNSNNWEDVSFSTRNQIVNSLANLTLLSGEKNVQANNFSFEEKIKIYRGEGKSKNITSFASTRKIISDYDNNIFSKKWNENAIINRAEWFFELLSKFLDTNLDDKISEFKNSILK